MIQEDCLWTHISGHRLSLSFLPSWYLCVFALPHALSPGPTDHCKPYHVALLLFPKGWASIPREALLAGAQQGFWCEHEGISVSPSPWHLSSNWLWNHMFLETGLALLSTFYFSFYLNCPTEGLVVWVRWENDWIWPVVQECPPADLITFIRRELGRGSKGQTGEMTFPRRNIARLDCYRQHQHLHWCLACGIGASECNELAFSSLCPFPALITLGSSYHAMKRHSCGSRIRGAGPLFLSQWKGLIILTCCKASGSGGCACTTTRSRRYMQDIK